MAADQHGAPSAHRSARQWTTYGIAIGLLAAIAVHVARSGDELADLQRLSIRTLILTSLIQFVSQLALNGSLLLPLQTCVKNLGFWELYLVRTGGLLVGSMVPVAGGLAVRLAYLRSRGVTYVDFAWATLLSNVLALVATGALAAAATGTLWAAAGRPPAAVLAVSVGVLVASLAVLAGFELVPRLSRHPRLFKWRWLSGVRSRAGSRGMSWRVFALSLVRHLLNFVTFGLLSQSFSGRSGDLLTGGLLYALTSPVRMVNLTPGNLGITEWVVALVGKTLAFDVSTGLLAALAFRGVGLAGQALGTLAGSVWFAVQKKRQASGPRSIA